MSSRSRAGSGLPRPIGVERHALASRQLGGLGERLALGRLAVGEQHDRRGRGAAELGEDLADPVAEPRLGPGRLERADLGDGRLEVAGPVHLGQRLGGVGDAVDPDAVLASGARGAGGRGP